jgi:hypothetical protein
MTCVSFNKGKDKQHGVRKTIFSIKVYVTLLDYLKFLRPPSQVICIV